MNEHQIIFSDAVGRRWSLTVLPEGKSRFLLEPAEASAMVVVGEKAVLVLDESGHDAPFALELDDNCSITLANESLAPLDEFLQNIDEFIEVAV